MIQCYNKTLTSLYGSEALGGVINIITEEPENEDIHGNTSYRFGSFNTHDSNVNLNQKWGKFGYAFFANILHSDGYDLRPETAGQTVSPFNNYTFNGQLAYDFSDKLKLITNGRYYQQDQDANLLVSVELFEGSSDIKEGNVHMRADYRTNGKLDLQYELYYTNYNASASIPNMRTRSTIFILWIK